MTIKEKIASSSDVRRFTLFKEGLFYKCYNEDVMLFVKQVREYKVNSKFVKSVSAEVLSLGFPFSELEKANLCIESVSEKIGAKAFEKIEGNIVFSLTDIEIKKIMKHGKIPYKKELLKKKTNL